MALAIDSNQAAATGSSSTGTGSLTYSFTNTAGTLLVCEIGWGSGGALTVSSVTYNGVSMTPAVSVGYDGATHNFAGCAIYTLLTPATGANNVVITMSGAAGGATAIFSGCTSFTGNNTTTPVAQTFSTSRESAGTTASVACTSTTSGNILVDAMATGSGYVSTGQTLNWSKNVNLLSAGGNGASSRANGSGGTVTMSYTISSDFMGIVAVEIAAAGGGGGTVSHNFMTMGVGA